MIITVNGEQIDFTLEKENTAGDVMNGLATWLEESSLIVAGVVINGDAIIIADEEWRTLEVDTVSTLDVEAVNIREGRMRQLETARDYFVLMNKAATDNDADSMKELSDGFTDLCRILPHLLGETGNQLITTTVRNSLSKAGFPELTATVDYPGLIRESEQIASLLESRRRETSDPTKEARSAAKALIAIADKLDDVAVNLQTGKDKLAMDTIIVLTELLQTLMRAISWMEDHSNTENVIEDLTGILSELEEALKVSDTVMIGDLLEYEIKPRLQELPGRLGFTEEAAT